RLLHDPESDRPAGLQLSSRGDRFLDVRAFRELDRNATPRRRPVSGLDGYREHRRVDPDPHPGGDRRVESSHDDAWVFWVDAIQPDAAIHGLWLLRLHGV